MSVALILGTAGMAHADNADHAASPREAASAIADVAPDVAAETTTVHTTRDADSAVVATTTDSTVDIPKDPAQPVTLASSDVPPLAISIGGAENAHDAKRTDNGTVVYEGTDTASSTAVQATDDGVRFMTVISGPDAPSDYRFDMTLAEGSQILATDDGGYVIVAGAGTPTHVINAPWAKDANGNPVPVSYSLDGTTIVMHVNHTGAAYPVVADPWTTIFKPWKWNKHVYNCILWGAAGAGVTAITGGAALPIAGSGAIGCAAGGLSR